MASGSNPSSKRKSSSSYKKKLSKKSSEVRKRKRSRSRKKDKSKKLHRRDDLVSFSDEDSRTELSSYSEDDYKRRKARSRTREDVKKSKKKIERSYSSDDSSVSPIRKKRKESKKSDGSKVKKKSRLGKSRKERSRRDVSVDSFSSYSRSCSTCRGGSDSEGVDLERSRRRGRSKGREKDKTPKRRYRSRSHSPCSGDNEKVRYHSEEKFVSENYPGRLRSVLTIPDEYYQSKDEIKAEVIQAYDDCPSPKSNDSYDDGRKKETPHKVLPEKKMALYNDKVDDDAFTSKSKSIQYSQSRKGDVGAQQDIKHHTTILDSTKPTNIVSSEVDDLESILRQKALENLRKFREHKGGNDIGVKQLSSSKDEPSKIEAGGRDIKTDKVKNTVVEGTSLCNLPKRTVQIPKAGDRMVDNKAEEKKIVNFHDIRKSKQNPFVYRRDTSSDASVLKQAYSSDGKSRDAKTIVNQITSDPPKASVGSTDSRETGKPTATLAPKTPTVSKIVSNPPKASAVSSDLHETNKSPAAVASESKTVVNKIVSEPLKALVSSSKAHVSVAYEKKSPAVEKIASEPPKGSCGSSDPGETNIPAHGSSASEAISPPPVNGEDSAIDSGNAATGGSGFEQKTMSVMRGGEMVQVNYKVYIPKKAPALARRKLQR